MKLIDSFIAAVLAFLGIKTEEAATEPAPAAEPPTVNWVVPEQGFETILEALQGYPAQAWWTMASDYQLYALTNPPSAIRFARRQVAILPKPCAEVDDFNVYYASYNRAVGVVVCLKDSSFAYGVFYYVMPKNEIERARRIPEVAEGWNDDLCAVAEARINAALTHYERLQQYRVLMRELGYSDNAGISIGQPGSSPVVRFGVNDTVIGPDVQVSEQYGDTVSVGRWALQTIPETGLWLHVADFEHDYRDEIRDTLAERRAA